MTQPTTTLPTPRKAWTAPRLAKVGTIADVAGTTGGAQNAQNAS